MFGILYTYLPVTNISISILDKCTASLVTEKFQKVLRHANKKIFKYR